MLDISVQPILQTVGGLFSFVLFALAVWYFSKFYDKNEKIVHVTRSSCQSKADTSPDGEIEKYFDDQDICLNLVDSMQLSKSEIEKYAFLKCHPMISLPDYFASLQIPPGMNFEKGLNTVLNSSGAGFIIPFTSFLPTNLRSINPLDSSLMNTLSFSSSQVISPIVIAAIAQTMHTTTRVKRKVLSQLSNFQALISREKKRTALMMMKLGDPSWQSGKLILVPNPFNFPADMRNLYEKFPEFVSPIVKPEQRIPVAKEYLPDLFYGDTGKEKRVLSFEQELSSRVFCILLNRLSMNNCPPHWLEENNDSVFKVIFEDGTEVVRPRPFISHLYDLGYQISMRIVTRVTSFGLSFSVADHPDGSEDKVMWKDVPVGFGFRTGIRKPDGSEIMTLLPHAALVLKIQSSDGLYFGVEYYQGVEEFTGWFTNHTGYIPWASIDEAEARHGPDFTKDQILTAITAVTVLSLAYNNIASRADLPLGGYGYTGMCLESVAIIQQVLFGKTTIFPIMIGGVAKLEIIESLCDIKEIVKEMNETGSQEIRLVQKLIQAVSDISNDISLDPDCIEDACQRILATVPERSPFLLAKKSRAEAIEVAEYIKTLLQKKNLTSY